jgi:hypothetical protein
MGLLCLPPKVWYNRVMETISGGPSEEFLPDTILQAAKLNKALENWVVTEVPDEDEGEIGDVVFVTGPGDGGSSGPHDHDGDYLPVHEPTFTGRVQGPKAIIVGDQNDIWGKDHGVVEIQGMGFFNTSGSFAPSITANGYRSNTDPTKWVSLNANGATGASRTTWMPGGEVRFAVAQNWPTGNAADPPQVFVVNHQGPAFRAMEPVGRTGADVLEDALTATYAEVDDDGNTDPDHESVALFEVITALVRQVRELSSEVESLKAAMTNG